MQDKITNTENTHISVTQDSNRTTTQKMETVNNTHRPNFNGTTARTGNTTIYDELMETEDTLTRLAIITPLMETRPHRTEPRRYWKPNSKLLEFIKDNDPQYEDTTDTNGPVNITTTAGRIFLICANHGTLARNEPSVIIPRKEMVDITGFRIFTIQDLPRILKVHLTETMPGDTPTTTEETEESNITIPPLDLPRSTLRQMTNMTWKKKTYLDTSVYDNADEEINTGPHMRKCINNSNIGHQTETTTWNEISTKLKIMLLLEGTPTHTTILTHIIEGTPLGQLLDTDVITPASLTHLIRCHTQKTTEGQTEEQLAGLKRAHGYMTIHSATAQTDSEHFNQIKELVEIKDNWNIFQSQLGSQLVEYTDDGYIQSWTGEQTDTIDFMSDYTIFEGYDENPPAAEPDTEEENSLASEGQNECILLNTTQITTRTTEKEVSDTTEPEDTPSHRTTKNKCRTCTNYTRNPTHCTYCWNEIQAEKTPRTKPRQRQRKEDTTPGQTEQRKVETKDDTKPVTDKHQDSEQLKCTICLNNKINSGFLHGNTIHIVACYQCAKKTQHQQRTCPICRRRITKVVKAFIST